ncbi:MAG TPA: signal peptidase I [Acidobacteriaceae bacterium]|nr:signal peptidase I [Acidobacteriaceae bacterium]
MEQTPLAQTAAPVQKKEETPLEAFASICGVLVLGLFVLTFIFQNFAIPSSSMENTLLIGDHVMVDRINLAPTTHWTPFIPYRTVHHGDIIVFFKPTIQSMDDGQHTYLVKRVIGIPGDHIHLVDGTVYLNGVAQNEPYAQVASDFQPYRDDFPDVPPPTDSQVSAEWTLDMPSHIQNGDLVVPPGYYFAMGDNRPVSLDSRYWGFVPRANIVGRPLVVYWSFISNESDYGQTSIAARIESLGRVVLHFFSRTRWERTFHLVK